MPYSFNYLLLRKVVAISSIRENYRFRSRRVEQIIHKLDYFTIWRTAMMRKH